MGKQVYWARRVAENVARGYVTVHAIDMEESFKIKRGSELIFESTGFRVVERWHDGSEVRFVRFFWRNISLLEGRDWVWWDLSWTYRLPLQWVVDWLQNAPGQDDCPGRCDSLRRALRNPERFGGKYLKRLQVDPCEFGRIGAAPAVQHRDDKYWHASTATWRCYCCGSSEHGLGDCPDSDSSPRQRARAEELAYNVTKKDSAARVLDEDRQHTLVGAIGQLYAADVGNPARLGGG